jgi:hypothetical protein
LNPASAQSASRALQPQRHLAAPIQPRYPIRPIDVLVSLAAAVILFPTVTEADRYFVAQRVVPVPKQLVAFIGLCLIFCTASYRSFVADGGRSLANLYRRAQPIIIPFTLLTAIALAGSLLPQAFFGKPGEFLKPVYNLSILLLAISLPAIPSLRRSYRVVFSVFLLILFISIIADLASPGQFSKQLSRAAGLSVQPNFAAKLLVLMCLIRSRWDRGTLVDYSLWLVCGIGVLATLSRGGLLLYLLAFLIYLGCVTKKTKPLLLLLAIATVIVVCLSVLAPRISRFVQTNPMLAQVNAQRRIEFFGHILRGDLRGLQAEPRVRRVYRYLDYIRQRPLLGHGTGFSYGTIKESHVLYIHYFTENGLIGLLAAIAFLYAGVLFFARRGDRRGVVFMSYLIFAGFHSHSLLEQKGVLTMLGILVGLTCVEASDTVRQQEWDAAYR